MSSDTPEDESIGASVSVEAATETLGLDSAMTADREEKKYLVPHAALEPLMTQLDRHLFRHRYTGKDANRLPEAQHFVTTIYFDTESHAQLRRAERDPRDNIKVRAKEYYDIHPTLAEVAVSPDEIVQSRPWLWLELKLRSGDRTEKARVRVAKRDVPSFFDAASSPLAGEGERIAAHCRNLGEPLVASCLVNYQRVAWQDPLAQLRVTLDFDVAFYKPPEDLWTRTYALLRSTLGPVQGIEPSVIVEVKRRGAVPPWLEATLTACDARESNFSKFVRAGRAVYG